MADELDELRRDVERYEQEIDRFIAENERLTSALALADMKRMLAEAQARIDNAAGLHTVVEALVRQLAVQSALSEAGMRAGPGSAQMPAPFGRQPPIDIIGALKRLKHGPLRSAVADADIPDSHMRGITAAKAEGLARKRREFAEDGSAEMHSVSFNVRRRASHDSLMILAQLVDRGVRFFRFRLRGVGSSEVVCEFSCDARTGACTDPTGSHPVEAVEIRAASDGDRSVNVCAILKDFSEGRLVLDLITLPSLHARSSVRQGAPENRFLIEDLGVTSWKTP